MIYGCFNIFIYLLQAAMAVRLPVKMTVQVRRDERLTDTLIRCFKAATGAFVVQYWCISAEKLWQNRFHGKRMEKPP